MTAAAGLLSTEGRPSARVRALESDYRDWMHHHVPHPAARWNRMHAYHRFVQAWPDLETWFASAGGDRAVRDGRHAHPARGRAPVVGDEVVRDQGLRCGRLEGGGLVVDQTNQIPETISARLL